MNSILRNYGGLVLWGCGSQR